MWEFAAGIACGSLLTGLLIGMLMTSRGPR